MGRIKGHCDTVASQLVRMLGQSASRSGQALKLHPEQENEQ